MDRAFSLVGMPLLGQFVTAGVAEVAELRDPQGRVAVSGLTVGGPDSGADVIIAPSAGITDDAAITLLSVTIIHA